MDVEHDNDEVVVTADIGPHLRTWRMFVSRLRWALFAAAAVLAVLFALWTQG